MCEVWTGLEHKLHKVKIQCIRDGPLDYKLTGISLHAGLLFGTYRVSPALCRTDLFDTSFKKQLAVHGI